MTPHGTCLHSHATAQAFGTRKKTRPAHPRRAGFGCNAAAATYFAVSVASAALKVALGRIAWLTRSRFGR